MARFALVGCGLVECTAKCGSRTMSCVDVIKEVFHCQMRRLLGLLLAGMFSRL